MWHPRTKDERYSINILGRDLGFMESLGQSTEQQRHSLQMGFGRGQECILVWSHVEAASEAIVQHVSLEAMGGCA